MAGSRITLSINDKPGLALFRALEGRLGNLRPVLAAIGEILLESVQSNFEEHRSPDGTPWQAVSDAYARWKSRSKGRNPSDILVLNRTLMGSITRKVTPDSVVIGTNMPYAAIHQFGGKTGRKNAATMPKRPFLGVRSEDWTEMKSVVTAIMMKGLL